MDKNGNEIHGNPRTGNNKGYHSERNSGHLLTVEEPDRLHADRIGGQTVIMEDKEISFCHETKQYGIDVDYSKDGFQDLPRVGDTHYPNYHGNYHDVPPRTSSVGSIKKCPNCGHKL